MQIERVFGFRQLAEEDLQAPGGEEIFFDPADTEVGAWVGSDLIEPGNTVMDLGSGSGAAAAAFARCRAGYVLGVDLSSASVAWATRRYSSPAYSNRVSFVVADFMTASTKDLVSLIPEGQTPDVVTSNPAYVPLAPGKGSSLKSIYGGPDGLMFVPAILKHAAAANARVGLSIGSYSSPRRAADLLAREGYSINKVTLAALGLGEFSKLNPERILELEAQREAVLWRTSDTLGYLIVGLSCRRLSTRECLSAEQLMALISCACSSASNRLESLSDSFLPELPGFSVRVLVLPDYFPRRHW